MPLQTAQRSVPHKDEFPKLFEQLLFMLLPGGVFSRVSINDSTGREVKPVLVLVLVSELTLVCCRHAGLITNSPEPGPYRLNISLILQVSVAEDACARHNTTVLLLSLSVPLLVKVTFETSRPY